MKTHHRLILALLLGAIAGTSLHQFSHLDWLQTLTHNLIEPVGQVFLRLIFMIVVPMVFCGLVLGVQQLGKHHGLGKVMSRTLLFTLISSALSVFIGIGLVNFFKPGRHVIDPATLAQYQSQSLENVRSSVQSAKEPIQALVEIIPKNPIEAAVRALDGEMLALMFFALIFGMALSRRQGAGTLTSVLEEVYEVCMRVVDYAMRLAPFAVFALVFTSTFNFGHMLLFSLIAYVGVVLLGLALQQFGVYSLLLHFFAKRSPLAFFKDCREVYIYAFATASSNATLPRSLELAETKLKIPPAVSRFVLTVGSTANQNGTALFEGITVLFLAQIYDVPLSLAQQVQVVLMSILAGIGTAGVPGGSLPLIMILLQQVGIPPEGLGLVLGVDRFLDMCRTTVNVSGDLVIAAVVGKSAKVAQK